MLKNYLFYSKGEIKFLINKNENTAELVGLSFGDGGLTYRSNSKRVKFQLRGHLIEDKEHYDNHIIPLFNKEIMFPIFGRNVGIVFNKNKCFYGLTVESVKIEKYFNELGIPSGIKDKLYVPKWIKNNKKFVFRFLRGFLDTDGCVSCQRNYSIRSNKFHTQIRIYLSCTSENLMKEIGELLKNLGFKILFRSEKRKNWKRLYRITLSGGVQVDRWFELIGSKNLKHITKYLIWKKFGFCPPYTTLDERKKILKKVDSPYTYYAEMPERSNGTR